MAKISIEKILDERGERALAPELNPRKTIGLIRTVAKELDPRLYTQEEKEKVTRGSGSSIRVDVLQKQAEGIIAYFDVTTALSITNQALVGRPTYTREEIAEHIKTRLTAPKE